MKRMTTIIFFTICFLAVGSLSYGQGKGKGYGHGCGKCVAASDTGRGMNYVDNDGDGICDNAGSHKGRSGGKGNRFRTNGAAGNAGRQGPNYVDNDGDGVCDNLVQTQDKAE